MKKLISHFWYSKSQRNGILFLITLTIILQICLSFLDFSSDELQDTNKKELLAFQHQIDSLKAVEIENRKPKIYPFNPNFITDFKGEQLGMSITEIDRLLKFRKQNKWINSPKQFQQVTKVSDSLFNKISPYFKFPNWVTKRNNRSANVTLNEVEGSQNSYSKKEYKKRQPKTIDINKATAEDLATTNGIGEKLSERIIKYRNRLQGFSFDTQLYEVWNIDSTVIKRVLKTFKIVEKPIIKKVNVNTASFKEVLQNPYIDYKLCKKIFEFRDEVAELQDISELKKIEDFPLKKYHRIILYLKAE